MKRIAFAVVAAVAAVGAAALVVAIADWIYTADDKFDALDPLPEAFDDHWDRDLFSPWWTRTYWQRRAWARRRQQEDQC